MTSVSAGWTGAPPARRPLLRRGLVAVAVTVAMIPAFVLVLAAGHGTAPVEAATSVAAMPLQQFSNDGANGHLWNAYDRTVGALGPAVSGRQAPVFYGSNEQVFVRSASGDLVQYVNDNAGGRPWNAYDLTTSAGGPTVNDDPSVVVVNKVAAYAFVATGPGDLVEYTNDGSGSHLWNATDITRAVGGAAVRGDVFSVVVGSTVDVFGQGTNGDLVEFTGSGTGGRSWVESDVSQASGGPTLAGSPGAVLYGQSSIHVYGTNPSGHLFEFVNDRQGGQSWSAYDLTATAAGPVSSSQPSAIVYGPTVHVYVNASGHLIEFVNDGAGGRLWNAYDLTSISRGPVVTGDVSAVFYSSKIVDIFSQGPGGDLLSYVNDGAGGRLWNAYDLTSASLGPPVGADPSAVVNGGAVSVFVAGPPPPAAVQSIVSAAESQDQNNLAVVENPPGSNCNIYTAYWGRGTTTGCAPGTSSEEWCSDFAEWAWAAAGIDVSGINGWSFTFVGWGQSHTGAWKPGANNNPAPGDAVVWGDMASAYGAHVGIVVGVSGGQIDVVSGNAGPAIDAAGDVDAVWESGYFDPTTSTVAGYPIIGYVSPTGWTGYAPSARPSARPLVPLSSLIASQDGGR